MVAFLTSAFLRTVYISCVCRLFGGYPNIVRNVLSGVSRMTLKKHAKVYVHTENGVKVRQARSSEEQRGGGGGS